MHATPIVEPLIFKTHILLAENALRALAVGLRTLDDELALRVAIYAREAILASYHAWEQLGKPADGEQQLTELRHRGHQVLGPYLAYADEYAIGFVGDPTLDKQASQVALVAMLWKVSSALDRDDEAYPHMIHRELRRTSVQPSRWGYVLLEVHVADVHQQRL